MGKIRFLFDCSFISPEDIYKSIPTYAIRLIKSLPTDIINDCALLIQPSMEIFFKEINSDIQLIKVFQIRHWTSKKCVKYINYLLYIIQIYYIEYESVLVMDEHRRCTLFKTNKRKVCVIHDLKSINGTEPLKSFRFFDKMIDSCDDVIAISLYTKKDIIRSFGTDENKVHVVYNSVSLPCQSVKPQQFLLFKKYLLYVNTLLPYKNVLTLIKAFGNIWNRYDLLLVVVGKSTDYWEKEIIPYAKEYGFIDRIKRLQDLTNEELKYLYENATLFVTTSLHEGFGYTPIEAAMCGCPVISTTCEALPDTTQNLVCYYEPPLDAVALEEKIVEILDNPPSKEKISFIERRFLLSYSPQKQVESILEIMCSSIN